MKSGLLFVLILLISSRAFAQSSVKGVITDAEDNKPVPYVSIGIINKTDGTVSTVTGNFKIDLDVQVNDSDTLKFSSVGYKSKAFLVADIHHMLSDSLLRVSLEKSVKELKQADVNYKRVKVKILGYETESKLFGYGFSSNVMGGQAGVRIPIKHSNTSIENFSFFIIRNSFERLTFRLNVYQITDGKPGTNILNDNIILKIGDKQTGKITVDLSSYHITADNDVLVGLEWIEAQPATTTGTFAIAAVLFGSTYFKQASQYYWQKRRTGLGFSVKADY
ncbi:MAG: outer membrane protein with a CnaB-type/M14 peptidase domain [Mucilaginibacter sp.]|nr:outer membrane protein with a CnaB-type/M14 peptidase domain [Mucilaginibacter sp.]